MRPQLALNINKCSKRRLDALRGKKVLVSEKLDGHYGYINAGDNTVYSRTGKVINLDIEWEKFNGEGRFIFEMYDGGDAYSAKSAISTGVIELHLHDVIVDIREDALERVKRLEDYGIFTVVKHTEENFDDRLALAEEVWSAGGEGIMLKSGCYNPGCRDSSLMKLKRSIKVTGKVTGHQEGISKGSFVVMLDSGVEVKVAGITDDLFIRMCKEQPRVTLSCMGINASGKLREPKFNTIHWQG